MGMRAETGRTPLAAEAMAGLETADGLGAGRTGVLGAAVARVGVVWFWVMRP